jgi:hypothetical protein
MYSPLKTISKEEQRQQIKDQKMQQLTNLLVNKFRNKYNVNGVKEQHVDRVIKDEIKKMFDEGNPSEAALTRLDKKLEVLIKKARENPAPAAAICIEEIRSQGARSSDSRNIIARRSLQTDCDNKFQKTGL